MAKKKENASTPVLTPATADDQIAVFGARVHNLKNLDLTLPKNKLVVITGISGSGKSSLAFDTIYAEGQRRYMESFSAYARQFIGDMERPDVDKITGLSPVISIEQKTTNKNPRSTVGTITEIYDFLRLLYARVGIAYSYNTGKRMTRFSEEEIMDHVFKNFPKKKLVILAPLIRGRKGHYRELFEQLRKQGYLKVRVNGEILDLKERMQVDRYKIHDIELVVDRVQVQDDARTRISQSIQKALQMGKGLLFIMDNDTNKVSQYSKQLMCEDTGLSYEEPSPNTFSFNSPYGACPRCKGLGTIYQIDMDAVIPDPNVSINDGGLGPLGEARDTYTFKQVQQLAKKHKFSLTAPVSTLPQKIMNILLFGDENGSLEMDMDFGENGENGYNTDFEGVINTVRRYFNDTSSDAVRNWAESFMKLHTCPECNGSRLKKESLFFKVDEKNISELGNMDLDKLAIWFKDIEKRLDKKQNTIAKDILKEIRERLGFLLNVGLTYLTLNRATRSLSGGESQRIRLATQIGSQLMGITYILDEPSIGLHQRDNMQLIDALRNLREMGNTVIVVEHDKDIMLHADHLIDVGPGAGVHGGQIIAQGTPKQILKLNTPTAGYLNGNAAGALPAERRKGNGKSLELKGATGNNLKNVSVKLPLGTFICVTGVSGSGKSTLINETLYPILSQHAYDSKQDPMPYKSIKGLEHIDKVIEIDQSPIGRTPRSNPATYCGFFTDIRTLFSQVPEAKIRGYNAGRFSFNVKSGRCDVCEGGGMRVIEMNFLPDVYVHCEKCNGRRYNRETLEIRYKGKSISDVLDMTVDEAVEFFQPVTYIYRKIKTLQDVGLGYITLGQSATTLSGGEAQRVKLATELSKKDTGKTIYILDEPTTGLHFQDIQLLLNVLNKLVDRGNTVLVIEHNLDVIKMADHIIDLGPEGGAGGGTILCTGTPEQVSECKESHTARFLKQELKGQH
ncbi:excinuclease ABC subunit UvrA [Chitinophaga sancti]|uniref:UvrABC system protein A n=1 Tax=Chitinophaga sancti TaxID=1004 RepID=A0A1K1SDC1_9BACT|nr:excinuclease ABC subunit UvrA [Chitinophaga sancti]WQD59935.1 excinuclease ABC subunit UvrA [Chitinophaga sancti]WQG87935.1 excinuclease ABC subunit UvrA [Chitinophaga sancti]SFW82387.1 excinuclease ABC subunit A [Chitinophaga sancti]